MLTNVGLTGTFPTNWLEQAKVHQERAVTRRTKVEQQLVQAIVDNDATTITINKECFALNLPWSVLEPETKRIIIDALLAQDKSFRIKKALVEYMTQDWSFDINLSLGKGTDRATLLETAVRNNNFKFAELLIDLGADTSLLPSNVNGVTPEMKKLITPKAELIFSQLIGYTTQS